MRNIFPPSMTCLIFLTQLFAQPAIFNSRGVGGGGALFSPSFNPSNPNEFYIACDMSELFHTSNLGVQYDQVHFNEFVGGHHSKVCFTNNPGLLYSISYINDIGTPVTSTDNGVTWNVLVGNPDVYEDVYSIFVDYQNPSRIIISQWGGIYFSDNGGTSFTLIHVASDMGAGIILGGVFFDNTNIYIGTNDGVLVSTNTGASWATAAITGLPVNERIFSFCAAKSGLTTRFFCLTADVGNIYLGVPGSDYWDFMAGIYTCDYGTTNWSAAMGGLTVGTDFPMFIDMAENNIDIVWAGGSNSNGQPTMYKTTNAGSSWSNTMLTNNNQNIYTGWSGHGGDRGWGYGECAFGIDVCATNPNYAIIGDFGFPHYTSDGGATWHQAYVDTTDQHPMNSLTPQQEYYHSIGIENTTCWQVHWVDANNMWACYSDIRGCRSTDGGDAWSFDYSGYSANSSYRIVQHPNGNLFMGTSNIHDMYQSTRLQDAILDAPDANGRISYSTNGGVNWQELEFFNHPVFWIALDPSNPNRAYASVIHYNGGAGIGGVYRCDDLNNLTTATWTLLPDPPRTEKHPASLVVLNDGKLVATYSGRRIAAGSFTASSGVFIYDPVGNSWQDVSDPDMYYWTKDVVIDPNDSLQNTWYVNVFSGWGGAPNGLGGLFKTTNRGTNWTKLTGSMIDRATSCTFNPNNPNEIYLTTEGQGLWMSSNINSITPTFSQVMSYPFRQPERVFFNPYDPNEIWVTSFGNGMKVGLINNPAGIPEFELSNLEVYPNPSNGNLQLKSHLTSNAITTLLDVYGHVLGLFNVQPGINQLNISHLPPGIYFIRLGESTQKIIIR